MVGVALLAVSTLGLILVALQWHAQRRALTSPTPPPPGDWPGVSVLKPLKGADPALGENLESFFGLDYPDFELVFAVTDAQDPAAAVVRDVAARHPGVEWTLVADPREVGLNPKVNNLANADRHARHDVILISDSNVRVGPGYLRDLVAHLHGPGVGLVSSPVRGVAGAGLGGALETLQLNTYVLGGIAALHHVLGRPAVVGKSMMLRRRELDRLGGWRFLGRFLAEDQVCGEEVARLGMSLALSSRPVDNVIGSPGLSGFVARHVRWARLRRTLAPLGHAGEAFLAPLPFAVAGAALVGTPLAAAYATWVALAAAGLALSSERGLGVVRPAWHYLPLETLRSLLVTALAPAAWLASAVTWRGRRLSIGPRTELVPLAAPDAEPSPQETRGLVRAGR